jgi:uncharacterized 2Fe-2S/4Fe-4S cluster protein (DUF4445 family)
MSDTQTVARYKVHFMPDDVAVTVNRGDNLLSIALAAGVHINASCGGNGLCKTCKVKLSSGDVDGGGQEKLSAEEYDQGIRLACQSLILSDLIVIIPPESRLDKAVQADERKKSAGLAASAWRFNPPIKKYYLDLPPATLKDNANDLFRLMWGLKQSYDLHDIPINFDVIRKLPFALREKDWKVTVTTTVISSRPHTKTKITPKIINVEPGDTRDRLYALAIDVGTTTVCAQLLDLNRGKVTAETITFNKQISYGADVITRIAYSQKPGGLKKLQQVVVDSINIVIDELLKQSGVDRHDICQITVAGNPTMQHLLLGLDPKYIRLAPYTPNANFVPSVKAADLGIKLGEQVYVFTFPSISSYVGGDIVSGVISCGMHQTKKLTLYIDIGTNGEIVIGNADWMATASCSAGPAFEGGGIKHGMIAVKGAIEDFAFDPLTMEPHIKTIAGVPPRGICGSGLINTVAELLEYGLLAQNGKFNTSVFSPRIREGEDGFEYILAHAPETQIGRDIVITEVDIDNLIRAKAAMYAGCHTLSHSVSIDIADFEQVILAGNFGNSLNIERAITIGLLPDIPRERFAFIGNGSLSGARLVNFSNDMLNAARKVAQMMTNIELSENNDFNNNYVAALFLPHTDGRLFPSVMEKLSSSKNNSRSK